MNEEADDDTANERLDARGRIEEALDEFLTPGQIKTLVDEILTVTKQVWINCSHCQRSSKASVPDAKAVAGAIGELLNQAKGRPRERQDEGAVIVQRTVALVCDQGHECPECKGA